MLGYTSLPFALLSTPVDTLPNVSHCIMPNLQSSLTHSNHPGALVDHHHRFDGRYHYRLSTRLLHQQHLLFSSFFSWHIAVCQHQSSQHSTHPFSPPSSLFPTLSHHPCSGRPNSSSSFHQFNPSHHWLLITTSPHLLGPHQVALLSCSTSSLLHSSRSQLGRHQGWFKLVGFGSHICRGFHPLGGTHQQVPQLHSKTQPPSSFCQANSFTRPHPFPILGHSLGWAPPISFLPHFKHQGLPQSRFRI